MHSMEYLNNTIDDVINFCDRYQFHDKSAFIRLIRDEYGFTYNDAKHIRNLFINDRNTRHAIQKALTNIDRDLGCKDKRSLWNNFDVTENVSNVPEPFPLSFRVISWHLGTRIGYISDSFKSYYDASIYANRMCKNELIENIEIVKLVEKVK